MITTARFPTLRQSLIFCRVVLDNFALFVRCIRDTVAYVSCEKFTIRSFRTIAARTRNVNNNNKCRAWSSCTRVFFFLFLFLFFFIFPMTRPLTYRVEYRGNLAAVVRNWFRAARAYRRWAKAVVLGKWTSETRAFYSPCPGVFVIIINSTIFYSRAGTTRFCFFKLFTSVVEVSANTFETTTVGCSAQNSLDANRWENNWLVDFETDTRLNGR